MTILVTGATGNMGGEVIRHLRDRSASIRDLVRDLSVMNAGKVLSTFQQWHRQIEAYLEQRVK